MNRKTLILGVVSVLLIVGVIAFFILNPNKGKTSLSEPETKKEATLSQTYIDYADPTGFSFSYPDNVSIANKTSENEDTAVDPSAYADLQLFSKDKSGSLNLKIADTKYKTREEWIKGNGLPETTVPTEKKLGELKAFEVRTKDRLMLAAIDQGVLFSIEMPLIEEGFWGEVYNKVVTDFTFAPPQTEVAQTGGGAVSAGEEVVFEGEEVVE